LRLRDEVLTIATTNIGMYNSRHDGHWRCTFSGTLAYISISMACERHWYGVASYRVLFSQNMHQSGIKRYFCIIASASMNKHHYIISHSPPFHDPLPSTNGHHHQRSSDDRILVLATLSPPMSSPMTTFPIRPSPPQASPKVLRRLRPD
jgi:hypothetical protein